MALAIHGLAARQSDLAFAFLVLRLRDAAGPDELAELVRALAPVVADVDGYLDELLDDVDEPLQLVALPWLPPDADTALDTQRRLVERTAELGVTAAWFFQCGTALPALADARFLIDGEHVLDRADLGLACKLEGESLGGEAAVIAAFHGLWLAPYGGRHGDASVTVDRAHHAVHLWVERLATSHAPEELAAHLRWIAARLDEVVPIVHARFAGASAVADGEEPFVLGGNPLRAVHARGGEAAVDAWLDHQTEWDDAEVARMLRELALELAMRPRRDDDDDDDDDEDDEDASRHVATYAGELLRARALAGKLDPRAADRLLPVLDRPARLEHRRRAVVELLGALRHRAAVPALIQILDATRIGSALDSIGKEELVASTAEALGAIADPAAIDALARVAAAPGAHNDRPRPAAADALASCLAAAAEPRDVDDAVLASLLDTIRDRNDGELNAEAHFAYGRLARQLRGERRDEARRRLVDVDSARDDTTALLARHAALVLAAPPGPAGAPPPELRALLREGLTALDYDHDYTTRHLRVALRVAEALPELVVAADLLWLTRFTEPDIRARAHALLARIGAPLAAAPVFDAASARELDDHELVRWLGEAHVVHRAALVAEAGRRRLREAWPAIIDACHDVITRARQGGTNLLDPDTRVLEAAVPLLRVPPLDDAVVALFDRMLRHSNFHVKRELLQAPPHDERLIGGMFHVLGERWGWQEKAAQQWLARFQGSAAYEHERRRVGAPEPEPESESPEREPDLDTN